jgi:hypothetical protein
MVQDARYRARRRGLDFDICADDFEYTEVCPVLGIPLRWGGDKAGAHADNSPSLDRVDNSKGYVKGNVVIISRRANVLKGDGCFDEIAAIALYMARQSSTPSASDCWPSLT